MSERELPDGWAEATVGSLCELINGCAFKPSDWSTEGKPIIRIQNLNNSEATFNYYKGTLQEKYHVDSGELLFAWSGTPGTSFGAHIWNGPPSWLNQHIFRVIFNEAYLYKPFLKLALNQRLDNIIDRAHGGVGLRHITKGKFEETTLAVPPLNEQRRIADRIDALQARSRRARELLAEARTLLEQFRQSVLNAAFRGDLTAKWREEHPDAEPASELLKRIRAERRKRWEEAELAKYAAKGKTPPAGWRKKYPEPVRVDTTDLLELPPGWCWASLGELIYDGPTNGYSPKTHAGAEGSVSLKLSATSQGYFILNSTTTKPLPEVIPQNSYLWLEPGDLLIQRANTIDLVGTAAIFDAEPNTYVYPDLMSRVRLVFSFLNKWVWQLINSPIGRDYIRRNAVGIAGNMPKVNATTIRKMPVPLPPQDELLSCCKKLIAFHQKNLQLRKFYINLETELSAIDQSILAKAFRGELVPQDLNDEPATKLLERIQNDKQNNESDKPVRRKGKARL